MRVREDKYFIYICVHIIINYSTSLSFRPVAHSDLEKQQPSESPVASPVAQAKSYGQYKPGDIIYELLTASNYKNKFQELLKCEESTHKSILENR